jgi:hypothetical protein
MQWIDQERQKCQAKLNNYWAVWPLQYFVFIIMNGGKKFIPGSWNFTMYSYFFCHFFCQVQLNPDNSVYYRNEGVKLLTRTWRVEWKILESFRRVADTQNRKKWLNAHSENCLFYLQFKKITVYSFCHISVAFFLENVALDGWSYMSCVKNCCRTQGDRR